MITLTDVHQFETHIKGLYPNDSFICDRLRQILQHLRALSIIEFVDDAGTYRRI